MNRLFWEVRTRLKGQGIAGQRIAVDAFAAHASQVTDTGLFLAMPEEVFARAFSTEWFIEPGAVGLRHGWLLDGLT